MARFTISEIARRAEVSRDTVRNAERRGLIASTRDSNNWRVFDEEAVKRLCEFYRRSDVQPVG